jgi:hypothetical protein
MLIGERIACGTTLGCLSDTIFYMTHALDMGLRLGTFGLSFATNAAATILISWRTWSVGAGTVY